MTVCKGMVVSTDGVPGMLSESEDNHALNVVLWSCCDQYWLHALEVDMGMNSVEKSRSHFC